MYNTSSVVHCAVQFLISVLSSSAVMLTNAANGQGLTTTKLMASFTVVRQGVVHGVAAGEADSSIGSSRLPCIKRGPEVVVVVCVAVG